MAKIIAWIKKNKLEAGVLLVILGAGTFLRLYKISEYMTFLGDEGRDAIIVRNLLVHADPILIGPGTSIGNMYLGPLYYYMMAPALFLANYSPVGPSVMVALLGVATIFLIWLISRKWFKFSSIALGVAFLYAVSPTAIIFSRSSWNPNIMPFFSLMVILCIWEAYKGNYKWLLGLGVFYAFVLQSHYLGLLMFPVVFIYGIFICKNAKKQKRGKELARYIVFGILIFLFLMSPLVIFDLRHNFQNFKAMKEFLANSQGGSFKSLTGAFENVTDVYQKLVTRLPAGRSLSLGQVITLLSFLGILLHLRSNKYKKMAGNLAITITWILFGVVGLSFVTREIFDHYMGFLFAAPYLLFAALVSEGLVSNGWNFLGKKIWGRLATVIFLIMAIVNFVNSPIQGPPNRQLQRSREVAQKILNEATNKKFNLAVLAVSNYEDGYRYFLDVAGARVLHADIWDKSTIADILFVVCEKPVSECQPTTSDKAEVANFGASEVINHWEVDGVQVYKVGHKML